MQRMDIDTEYNQQDERVCTQDHGCYTQIRSNLYVCGISKMQNIDDKPWDQLEVPFLRLEITQFQVEFWLLTLSRLWTSIMG